MYTFDSGGVGAGLKRQIDESLDGKRIAINMFQGQARVEFPDAIYDPTPGNLMKAKSNKEVFYNLRAQMYWKLRDRVYRTYLAVKDKRYTDPSELISFSSKIPVLSLLRSELCRIPLKHNGAGKIQIMTKDEMKREGIDSPNLADSCMMSMLTTKIVKQKGKKLNFKGL